MTTKSRSHIPKQTGYQPNSDQNATVLPLIFLLSRSKIGRINELAFHKKKQKKCATMNPLPYHFFFRLLLFA